MDKQSRRSIVAVLSEEHLKLQALSSELATTSSTSDHVDVLTAWVSRHLSAEQRYLYPVVRELLPEGERLIEEELNQDQVILRRLAALRSAPPRSFPQLADELVTDLRRHAYAAARDILPRLEELTHDDDLISLGDLVTEAAASAPTRPHPHTPDRPPWNRMIDPLVGAVDRMRDRVSHRKTSLNEL
ncbi:MAG TPA: hemerythrin domain-containing protein [Candidatus Limnocylindrales bacterium]|nr:hemerythrin domain-containing protein [Candidatus Limnocylindrales bacterium]